MAWNEPGNGQKGPWDNNGGGNRNEPPDLDEVIRNLQKKFGGLLGGGGGSGGGLSGISFGFLGLIVVAIWAVAGFYINEPYEEAVILRFGQYHDTVGSGLHWRMPIVDQKVVVNVQTINSYELPGDTGAFNGRSFPGREGYDAGLMLTQDENIVDTNITVLYRVKDVKDYVLNVKSPDRVLEKTTEAALRQVIGQTDLGQMLTVGREVIERETHDKLQNLMDLYGTGLIVTNVNLRSIEPPEEVKVAFDDVIKAREDREKFINTAQAYYNEKIPEARGNAERIRAEARAYKEQKIAHARGEAERFSQLLVEYKKAPKITRERLYLEAVEDVLSRTSKVLVDIDGGQLMYLPLDKIISASSANSGSTTNSDGSGKRQASESAPSTIDNLKRYSSERDRLRTRARGVQ